MDTNKELELAWDFVERTDRNIFLTGKAGTGKTTFLHKIRTESFKRMVVVAPTGVAAINAKGVTIHSFFQMAFGPILPPEAQINNTNSPSQKKFNRRKIDIIKSLDLLIIDEISMVRADLLDGIDQVLRKYKNRSKVFGGVQVLMIGDLQQLAPVVKQNEWQLLQPYYNTAFFFSSRAFQESNAIGIELKHIFRQQNKEFIGILNEIRNNIISDKSLSILNRRYIEGFKANKDDGYITLTTHNNQADSLNNNELQGIKSPSRFFTASVEKEFPEHIYPTHYKLEFKIGAQVMFIKNDSEPEKRFFNGKIGKIVKFDNNKIIVRCPDDDFDIETSPETWENINFTLNAETKEITENIKGSFSQMPLRLAWAITIHKSQGLTFEKAIIDVTSSFAHGQTYVALSRCKTLEGIVLKRPVEKTSIIQDNRVISFTKDVEDNPPNNETLNLSRKQYQLNLIEELFNYKQLFYIVDRCNNIIFQAGHSLQGNISFPLKTLRDKGVNELIKVGDGFKRQLAKIAINIDEPEKSEAIQDRIKKAVDYFLKHTEEFIIKPLSELSYTTDNAAINKDLKNQLKRIEEITESKVYCFKGLDKGFSTTKYLELRAKSVLQNVKTKKTKKEIVDTGANPKLFALLRGWRHETANIEDLNHYQIFTQKSLFEICEVLPITKEQLLKINGMGKTRVKKYGDEILEIITEYCEENEIEATETNSTKEVFEELEKQNTKEISLDLLNQGMDIPRIAKHRGLTIGTIEGHLIYSISQGLIKVEEAIGKQKSKNIKKLINKTDFENLSDLKAKLDDEYSYNELRMALIDLKVNN